MSLSSKLSITDVDLKGKRVLIRVRLRYQKSLLHLSTLKLLQVAKPHSNMLSSWQFCKANYQELSMFKLG
jgi:hypothetical protein